MARREYTFIEKQNGMEKNIKNDLLKSMGNIYKKSRNTKLEHNFFISLKEELEDVSAYFQINQIQAVIVSLIFVSNYKSDTTNLQELSEHLKCEPLDLLNYIDEVEALIKTGVLHKKRGRRNQRFTLGKDEYYVDEKITQAILQNKEFSRAHEVKANNMCEVFEKIEELCSKADDREICTFDVINHVFFMQEDYKEFQIMVYLNKHKLEAHEAFIFLYIAGKALKGYESVNAENMLSYILDTFSLKIQYTQQLIEHNTPLQKLNLIELEEGSHVNDLEIKLSSNSLKLLSECGFKIWYKKNKNYHYILPEEIVYKKLHMAEKEKMQLNTIREILQDATFKAMQQRLQEKGLPTGINILLHGAPGTGKTETVYQLARESGRAIHKVELSKLKSMWFGESEKKIAQIFRDYKTFASNCECKPILLFNEADAIFSTRKELHAGNTSQTENAMQNILLDEMETFDGILMATTNLVGHFDKAFDRRFLFKVAYQKPDEERKEKIWQSKLPSLGIEECRTLAGKYDFTGGQIDNIARKFEIEQIIKGTAVTFETICRFCEEEIIAGNHAPLGFAFA